MREIQSSEHTIIRVTDEPGAGGACHEYEIRGKVSPLRPGTVSLSEILFQNGPIAENGVNGCQNEDLLRIVIDRLESFQAGPFPCKANSWALGHCQDALQWLKERTRDRQKRGVEGKGEA